MNRRSIAIIAAAVALAFLAGDVRAQKTALPAVYKKWLDEEVVHIITPLERDVFLKLQTDRERDSFVEAFWKHRDPTPYSPENEFKAEHYRRINYVNKYYGRTSPMPGWRSDRGRVYIILGEPNDIQKFDNEAGLYPVEIWFYQNKESFGLPTGFHVVFYQRGGLGDYRIYSPAKDGPQALMTSYTGDPLDYQTAYQFLSEIEPTVADVSMSLIPGESTMGMGRPSLASDMLIQKVENASRAQVEEMYAKKFLQYKDMVEVEYTANYLDCGTLTKVSREPSGTYFVHYAVEPKRLSVESYESHHAISLKVNGTVMTLDGKLVFQFEKPVSMTLDENQMKTANAQPLNLLDMFPLIPGTYKLSVLVKNDVSKEFMSFEEILLIPGDAPALQMTSPVLGSKAIRADASQKPLRPFQIGPFQILIQPTRVFARKDTLAVAFQVSGLSEAQKRSGQIRFVFTRNGQPVFDRVKPLAECSDLPDILTEFSLADFVPAHYNLKVSVVDDGRELVAGTEEFDLSFRDAVPKPWYYTKRLPEAADPVYALIIGSQLFNIGRLEEAKGFVERAYRQLPGSADAALSLARIHLALGQPEKAVPVLDPFLDASQTPKYEIYVLAGQALQRTGDFAGALSIFDRAVSHFGVNANLLNMIGDSYARLGRPKDAQAVWEKSLEINSNQPEIKKKLDGLKEKK
ncbi:MAG: GWxTD domain-containing protein [Candidatus Aminicenantes bacterium]|nr:GWxTD domain-containing protein [Candidatus Aminicenantes bacterium]